MKYIIPILFFNLLLCQDIGQKMFKNGDTDSAIKYYQHLLEDEDLSKDNIIYNLASIYSSVDSLERAEEFFNLAIQDSLNPSAELSYNRGNMFFKSQKLEESLKSYRDALLKNPNDDEARKIMSLLKMKSKKTNKINKKINRKMKIVKNLKIMRIIKMRIKIRVMKIRMISQMILIKIQKIIIMTMDLQRKNLHNPLNKKIIQIVK